MSDARPRARLLVTDLDNTLWDWFEAWHASFSAMLDSLVEMSGVDRRILEREIRLVHQRHGTTEYSWLIEELPSLRKQHGSHVDLLKVYDEAIYQQHSARKRYTSLYPGVYETLRSVKASGAVIIAYTESQEFWTERRIKMAGLDGLIDTLYSAPDHARPPGRTLADVRTLPPNEYGLRFTEHRLSPAGTLKPDLHVLTSVLTTESVPPREAVYVGDSLSKDVRMAQRAGVHDVHARYGVFTNRPEYELLQRVSHWTDEAVNEEDPSRHMDTVLPSHTIDNFAGLLKLFDFTSARTG